MPEQAGAGVTVSQLKNTPLLSGWPKRSLAESLQLLPTALAPLIQIPTMLLYLNLSERIRELLHPREMPEPTEMEKK